MEFQKLRIEEAAAIKQARIDSGIEKIIGVNYLQQNTEVKFDILDGSKSQCNKRKLVKLAFMKIQKESLNHQRKQQPITPPI